MNDNPMPLVLGLDPGFASLGWCVVDLTEMEAIDGGIVHTEKNNKKTRNLRDSEDNVRRAMEIFHRLRDITSSYPVSCICAETQSWPRNASVSAKMGICWGVIPSVAALEDIPILQASPMEIKRSVTGNRTATKTDVSVAASNSLAGLLTILKGCRAAEVPHVADAAAAVLACRNDPLLRALVSAPRRHR